MIRALTQPADARQDPPWTDCGDPRDLDFGQVYTRKVARDGVALSFDRAGRRHAVTLFGGTALDDEIVLYGRRFRVVRQPVERGQ